MIVDAHAHLEPRLLPVDALLRKLDEQRIDRVVLIPPMNDLLPHTPERLLALARRLMRSGPGRMLVERVHRATLTPEGDLKLSGQVVRIYSRPDNAAVARLAAERPDRVSGWIFLNPRNNPTVLDELERWRAEPGMIGIKLHPHWHDYRTEIADPVFRRAEELGLPVLIHLGFGRRGDYATILARYPRLVLLAAHAGFPYFDQVWRYGRDRRTGGRLRVDVSSPYLDEALVRAAVEGLGAERCLYGTDSPYGFEAPDRSYDYGRIRGWVERLPCPSRAIESVLGTNFLALIDDARAQAR